ncbi:uncharacterized protein LOC119370159 [Jatropha curcas]|uniref:uncharacterized protein LOC119370159 n=1 Tax=Jatropha curcas TaxID=180498 RepID=UPI0018952D63|nr:uncharacterized protein LOC119370159 [Jatropha curcas]
MKTEWGFDQFVLHDAFNDSSNGYLIDDRCVFGAEVFVVECTGKGERMSIVKELSNNAFTWKVQSWQSKENLKSQVLDISGLKCLSLYPNGNATEKGKSFSMYLVLEDSETKLNAEYILRVRDQLSEKHHEKEVTHQFGTKSNHCKKIEI